MTKKKDLWYHLGFALETARQRIPAAPAAAGKLLVKSGKGAKGRIPAPLDPATQKIVDAILTVGAGTLLTRFLSFWPGTRRPGIFGLGRAGAAGAAAAFLTELLRPALLGVSKESPKEDDLTDIILSGVGRGLVYAAILEPRFPGPSLLRGSVYGAMEWALTPWGGLEEIAGSAAPQGKIPVLSTLLQGRKDEEDLLEHIAFGVALAILYEG